MVFQWCLVIILRSIIIYFVGHTNSLAGHLFCLSQVFCWWFAVNLFIVCLSVLLYRNCSESFICMALPYRVYPMFVLLAFAYFLLICIRYSLVYLTHNHSQDWTLIYFIIVILLHCIQIYLSICLAILLSLLSRLGGCCHISSLLALVILGNYVILYYAIMYHISASLYNSSFELLLCSIIILYAVLWYFFLHPCVVLCFTITLHFPYRLHHISQWLKSNLPHVKLTQEAPLLSSTYSMR